MARTVKQSLKDMGETVADAAKSTGKAISEGASELAQGTKEALGMGDDGAVAAGTGAIHEHVPVIASCGCTIGMVDAVEDGQIKLTRKDSPDNHHHFIPLSWVARVDEHVHLNVDARQAQLNWI